MITRLTTFVIAVCFSPALAAQEFPSKPISIVVPYPAGGTNDILARLVGSKMAGHLGVPVVVENRAGAGGNIGARHVARSAPDGYTLGAVPAGVLSINQWVYTDAGFDPSKDLLPITLGGSVPNVLVANGALPADSVSDLVKYVHANPGKISFASMGTGTTGHLCAEMFKLSTRTDMMHVPYKGAAPALADLMAGHVQLMCDNLTNALPHIQAGKLKALAVTSLARSSMLPDVPTLSEAGIKDFEATAWFGFVAPAGTAPSIVDKLNREMVRALKDPDVSKRLTDLGMVVVGDTPVEFQRFVDSETKKWKEVAERSGARAN